MCVRLCGELCHVFCSEHGWRRRHELRVQYQPAGWPRNVKAYIGNNGSDRRTKCREPKCPITFSFLCDGRKPNAFGIIQGQAHKGDFGDGRHPRGLG
jgi:hypothetical protein